MTKIGVKEAFLFMGVAFISGAGWYFVPSQVVDIHPFFSIGYRFVLSSVFILGAAALRKEPLFDRAVFPLIFFQGLIMFPLNYILTYSACKYVTSGLVGVISSMALIPAYGMGVLTKRHKTDFLSIVLVGGAVLGLVLLFQKDFRQYGYTTFGILLAILGAITPALGLSIVEKIKRETPLSILAITGTSMLSGGLFCLLFAAIQTGGLEFGSGEEYVRNLLILSGLTPVVFVSFFYFSNKYGAFSASYIWVIAPVFSVLMSIFFEGYAPQPLEIMGIFTIVFCGMFLNRRLSFLKTTG